jgi:hypothetical protein
MVNSSCSTCGTRCLTLVTNPVISHEWGNDWIVITTHFYSGDGNVTTRDLWFSSLLGSSNPLSWKSCQAPQALEYRINWEIYTPKVGAAGMLLHINGKFIWVNWNRLSCRKVYFLTGSLLAIEACVVIVQIYDHLDRYHFWRKYNDMEILFICY